MTRTRRYPRFWTRLSLILALLFAGIGVLPSPSLWRCLHSGQLLVTANAAAPTVMPCGMRAQPEAAVTRIASSRSCCRAHPASPGVNRLGAAASPVCRTVYLRTLSLPTAALTASTPTTTPTFAPILPPATLPTGILRLPTPLLRTCRQRPPPAAFSLAPASAPHRVPGLRAPPIAFV